MKERSDLAAEAIVFHAEGTLYRRTRTSEREAPYDGVLEMLRGLRSAAILLVAVTEKTAKEWGELEAALDLGRFDAVVTGAHADRGADQALAAAQTLGVAPRGVVYLTSTAEGGRGSGMRVGSARWGDGEGFYADWVFERPADVVRTFAMWC